MTSEEKALIYFKDLRARKVKDYSSVFDTAPKDSVVYEAVSAEIEIYDTTIKALEQTRWIPVSEKPQEGRYLCTFEHYDGKCIDFGSFDGEKWYIKPIAYMPLPEPYKAESEDEE